MDEKRVPIEVVAQLIAHAQSQADMTQLRDLAAAQFTLFSETAAMVISCLHWSHIADGLGLADAIEEAMKEPELACLPLMGEMSQVLAARIRDSVLALPLDSPERP